MIQPIDRIEYRSGMLGEGMKPDDLAVQTWHDAEIPSEARMAICREDLLSLGGSYGDPKAPRPVEYDHLRIMFPDKTVDIAVFGRAKLASGSDAAFQRVHHVLRRLNKAMMAVPDVFTSEQRAGSDPRLPLPPGAKFTCRDQANVMTLLAFRNGPIEDLAELPALRGSNPEGFAQLLAANWRQVRKWER